MTRWWNIKQWRSRQQERALQKSLRGITSVNGVKNISLGANPLLTSHTPLWRSRLIVAGLALGLTSRIGGGGPWKTWARMICGVRPA